MSTDGHWQMLDWISRYTSLGWSVIPLIGKKPAFPGWQNGSMLAPEEFADWLKAHPGANIGIVTGELSGFFVLDVDGAAGEASLAGLVEAYGALPKGP